MQRTFHFLFIMVPLFGIGCYDPPSAEQETTTTTQDRASARNDSLPPRIDFTMRNRSLRVRLAQGTCTEWKLRGDSLHARLERTTQHVEQVRQAMDQRPLNDKGAADSVFASYDGTRLYHELVGFYTMALRSAADSAALRRTEGLSMQVLSFPSAEAWRRQCFTGLPRVASSTILSKISTDMLLLENLCLHSILKECERSVGGSPFPEPDTSQAL